MKADSKIASRALIQEGVGMNDDPQVELITGQRLFEKLGWS